MWDDFHFGRTVLGTVVNSGKGLHCRRVERAQQALHTAETCVESCIVRLLPWLFWAVVVVKPANKGLISWTQAYIAVTEPKTTLAKTPAREFSCLRKQKWRLLMVSSRVVRPSPCLKTLFGSVFSKARSRFTLGSQCIPLPRLALTGRNCIVALKRTLQRVG